MHIRMGEVTTPGQVKAYLTHRENLLLVENREFGRCKYFSVGMNRQFSLSKKSQKQWVHPPEALSRGHIVYNVKFMGHVEVEQPKGTEVVREAIRKMKFNKQIKKAEGQKLPKVELTISVDGVTIQEPKFKVVQHRYPLHRISYCADDKADKRMFTFIAKSSDSDRHDCFVFDSEKCAEEITLTIGQAFDLAYRRFLESSNKDLDSRKQSLVMQKKVQQLTEENLKLKARVADLERLIDPHVLDMWEKQKQGSSPSRTQQQPVVGRKLENLVLDEDTSRRPPQSNGFVTSATSASGPVPALAPPPPIPHRANIGPSSPSQQLSPPVQHNTANQEVDLFGATPFNQVASPQTATSTSNPFTQPGGRGGVDDPFGMEPFQPSPQELDRQIQSVDKELMDLQAGFSQGLSFGADDFTLADLDPLNKKK